MSYINKIGLEEIKANKRTFVPHLAQRKMMLFLFWRGPGGQARPKAEKIKKK